MEHIADTLRLLADPLRLRILRLLGREELTVGELVEILGVAQPSVSRQVAGLRQGGLAEERRSGRYALLSLAPAAREPGSPAAVVLARLDEQEDTAGDLVRLRDVLRARRDRLLRSTDGSGARPFVPGRSWAAWARALAWLVPPGLRVVDLGCGDGALTFEIARFAGSVSAVDLDPVVLSGARAAARRRKVKNVRFVEGDMHALAFEDGSFDVAVLAQALHYSEDPARAAAEAARVTAPGGRVLVLDLLPHEEVWVRERLSHKTLGFRQAEMERLLEGARLRDVHVERMPARARDPFRVLVGTGVRTAAGGASKRAARGRKPS